MKQQTRTTMAESVAAALLFFALAAIGPIHPKNFGKNEEQK